MLRGCAPFLVRRNQGGRAVSRAPGLAGIGVLTVVVDFQRGARTIAVAHFDKKGQRKDAVVGTEVELALLVADLFDVDHGIADMNNGGASPRERPEEIDEFSGHSSFPVAKSGRRRANSNRFLNSTPRILIGANTCSYFIPI